MKLIKKYGTGVRQPIRGQQFRPVTSGHNDIRRLRVNATIAASPRLTIITNLS